MVDMGVDHGLPGQVQCKTCGLQVYLSAATRCDRTRVNEKTKRFKCRPCKCLEDRIYRMKRSNDIEVSFQSAAAKEAFFQKHHAAFGADLKAALELVTSEVRSPSRWEGGWLDEVALTERHASNPEQLNNLLQNTPRMEHPVTKVTLYLDVEFKSTSAEERTFKKATRKPKKNNPTKAQLLHKQRMIVLAAAVEAANALIDKAAKLLAEADPNNDFLPKATFETLESKMADLEAAVALAAVWQKGRLGGWYANHRHAGLVNLISAFAERTKALANATEPLSDLVEFFGRARRYCYLRNDYLRNFRTMT